MATELKDTTKLSSLVSRFTAPTPDFWKKIRNIMITIGGIGLAITTMPVSIIVFPSLIVTIGSYMTAIGVIGAATAQTTIK